MEEFHDQGGDIRRAIVNWLRGDCSEMEKFVVENILSQSMPEFIHSLALIEHAKALATK